MEKSSTKKIIKKKYIQLGILIFLALAMLSFGIYAAISAGLGSVGTVTFFAYGIDVDVECSIENAIGEGIVTSYAGTTNKTRQPAKNDINTVPWQFGNLQFDEINYVTPNPINIRFNISNFSEFPISAKINLVNATNFSNSMTYTLKEQSYIKEKNGETLINFEFLPKNFDNKVTNASFGINLVLEKTVFLPVVNFTSSGGEITSADLGSSTRLILPSEIGGQPITKIADNAFLNNTYLKEIIISKGITTIGENAFRGCSNLTTVVFPEGLTTINNSAFRACPNLKGIVLPESLTTVGMYIFQDNSKNVFLKVPDNVSKMTRAFTYMWGLVTIEINKNVNDLDHNSLWANSSLVHVNLDKDNPNYTIYNNMIFTKDMKTLIYSPSSQPIKDIIIPEGVTTVQCAFFVSKAKSIYFPKSVSYIDAMGDIFELEKLEVDALNPYYTSENNVLYNKNKTILYKVASKNSGDFIMPDSVINIYYGGFNSCGYTNITLSKNLEIIGYACFSGASIKNIKLQKNSSNNYSLKEIKGYAFNIVPNLTGFNIPLSVIKIDGNAFNNFTSSQNITVAYPSNGLPSGWVSNWYTGTPSLSFAAHPT